jgi:glycosyltransferase involved in cell wall biosynthesis
MRVLMVTQAVDLDDPVLGFTHTWVNALARRVEQLHVMTLVAGRHHLADNVVLHAYGPPGASHNRLSRWWFYNQHFTRLILSSRVDVVFIHMIPRWVLLAAPYAKMHQVPILLWYTHRQVTLQLRLAHCLADRVVTASPESYGLKDAKVIVVGHGVDTDLFCPAPDIQPVSRSVLAVGRLSPIKDYETLIRAAHILVHQRGQKDWHFTIVGEASPTTADYEAKLRMLVANLGLQTHVTFAGAVPNAMLPDLYRSHSVSVNLCPTGGMDKVVLESLACGTPVLVCNWTFVPLLGQHAEQLMFHEGNAADLADHLERLASLSAKERGDLVEPLREKVSTEYSVDILMDRVMDVLGASVYGG